MTAPGGRKGIVGVLGGSCNAEDDRLQLRDVETLLSCSAPARNAPSHRQRGKSDAGDFSADRGAW